MTSKRVVLVALGALLIVNATLAADLGDPAPALKIKDWAKGSAIDLSSGKGKNVYVVEFWATWCPPCRASIPHLTELQKKFKDKGVVFIGVSDEEIEKVKPFVDQQGTSMDYVVACDDSQTTKNAYLNAFKIQGIPHAFIVDKDGKIAWHDHPMEPTFEVALEMIAAGKFDKAGQEKINEMKKEAAALRTKINETAKAYFELARAGNDGARAKGEEFLALVGKDKELLNAFAWTLLTMEGIPKRDLELGLRVAKAANDASEGKDPAILDTYARALFDNGKIKEALEYQKKAVELCKDPEMAKGLKEALATYEKAAAEKNTK